jgi:hypothetical protein
MVTSGVPGDTEPDHDQVGINSHYDPFHGAH